jgi:hypothetical protein
MPVSALEALSTRLKKATRPFELIVRSPTLALKEVPNKFMNNLTDLKNLTGLDVTAWTGFPTSATKKICQMTFLQQLSSPDFSFNFANLSTLTKLCIPGSIFVGSIQIFQTLTNLRDLRMRSLRQEHVEEVANLSLLTRLHFGISSNFTAILTTLTNLKDLAITAWRHVPPILTLVASCTTLESLHIDTALQDPDIDWISSNTKLTKFHISCHFDYQSPRFHPLTHLRNITSAKFVHTAQLTLFSHLKLTSLEIEPAVLDGNSAFTEILKYTDLQSLSGQVHVAQHCFTTLVNLTQLTWRPLFYGGITGPTSLKELSLTICSIQNLPDLTNLESLTLNEQSYFDIKAKQFAHLTKLRLNLKGAQQAILELPKLSNLFSLRELYVNAPNNYQGVNADFLTTLTNLEMLDMAQINIPLQIFTKIVHRQTILTQLRVNCSESNGEILTRLTNLQILYFYSRQPMKGLKLKLEEVLPRLVECQI